MPLGEAGPAGPFCIAHAANPGLVYCNDLEPKIDLTAPFGFSTADISDGGTVVVNLTSSGSRS